MWRRLTIVMILAAGVAAWGCNRAVRDARAAERGTPPAVHEEEDEPVSTDETTEIRKATFGAGCFWCVEAVFQELEGVTEVISGYQGGETKNPTYKQVCTGDTGHAEVVEVRYDPSKVSYEELLDVFWKMHDPTTLNRQGADVGSQYRSVIFYHDAEQKRIAEESRKKVDASGKYDDPVVTKIVSADEFYAAEEYHQDYFKRNPDVPYSWYIRSKLKKLGL